MKFQSAMEYLSTYGWAVLAIFIALVALYAFGAFNGNTYAPKASPGSCTVSKNTFGTPTLSGVCTSQIPQFVASFSGNGGISVNTMLVAPTATQFSESSWVYFTKLPSVSGTGYGIAGEGVSPYCNTGGVYCFGIYLASASPYLFFGFDGCGNINTGGSFTFAKNTWYNLIATFGSTSTIYVNGKAYASGTGVAMCNYNVNFNIGSDGGGDYFDGYMSNVQLYNTTLSAASVQALYNEGIGGAPIDLQDLVGWWPLNGDTKDYSGNGNSGSASGVSFISSWYNTYAPPGS
ncbi:MAG: LamG domain-containing protein [Candidatus Micrarchaeota archaeon]|nr:LamG domain-containing protein [Candidatus Micrarchaeota archaeon]MDE1858948.1 LamG domain-containing protein [Candidatus Micrarchaeota archaeon]